MATSLLLRKKLYNGLLILFFLSLQSVISQNRTYATVVASESNVDSAINSTDQDLNTSAIVRASSGLALGLGAYAGHLELRYAVPLQANTTSYIKIDSEDELLPFLLGGNLGNLLANLGGTVLLGNQEFTVEAKNGATTILQANTNNATNFASASSRIVIDETGDYFVAMTPNLAYDRLRLTNNLGSLIGVNNTKNLTVFGAFHGEGTVNCGSPSFTSFDGSGLSLDLLNLGGAGVTNPELAMDGDPNTASELSLGILAVTGTIAQTFYFDTVSNPTDQIYMTMAINPSLLQLGILDNISVTGVNGANEEFSDSLTSLLSLDIITLLQSGEATTFSFNPGTSIDKVTLGLSSLLNVSLPQNMNVYEVFLAPAVPNLDASSTSVAICEGSSANLVANTQDSTSELRWYDAAVGGNLLVTLNSGDVYTTPTLVEDQIYYVAAATPGCSIESPRVGVPVTVAAIPTADDISVSGNEFPLCSSSAVVLHPSSAIQGEYSWYFDQNKTMEITDGMEDGDVNYAISAIDGSLTITGLDEANSPYTYYVSLEEASAGCENVAGDLKEVQVTIVDSNTSAEVNIDIDSGIVLLDELIGFFGAESATTIAGAVTGDVVAGDVINLLVNNTLYTGVLDTDLNFTITVDGIDLVSDLDHILDVFVEGGVCTTSGNVLIDLPDINVNATFQEFCASDNPTLADLIIDSNLSLFDALDINVAADLNTPLVDGSVYFAGILDIPNSILPRVQITVGIRSVPAPTTSEINQEFCESSEATIGDLQVNETDVVFYDSETEGTVLDPTSPLMAGTYFVAAVVDGCESSERLIINVSILASDIATITGEREEVCIDREYRYTTEDNRQNYVWEVFGGTIAEGGTSTDNFISILWDDLEETSLRVSYENTTGCGASVSETVSTITCGEVLGEEFGILVYNEFSPNNDGFNDYFVVKGILNYSSRVQIYNRNGNLVFETENYQNDWNGIATVSGVLNSGDDLPSGTYYYVINIPELEQDLMGWLQLVR
ncbi:gliding motility-associated C-terminal domain-containing protein [Cellulophaga sp. HaHa_2_95]|uniref:T9SS type B sorting domain-containing protein n=1 Tax=Cellulophaga sp. HaHa_2_95 TaxID=2745558 RepID=UPI001C4F5D95|nr:gliding motility-associated C-terminal domain-containing protein [Cellulophaga sp. HaHa_2_95]QXP55227.1 gliding motility-associated C-terminal domain-containing protein [Cellulophaga sp. HaHa_2_95]